MFKAESAGPNTKKMTNKLKDTALITFVIYVSLSIVQIIALLISGLPLFDAITVTFATAGTGGFAPTNQSIVSYNNLAAEIIITIFMTLFSFNLGIYFLIFTGKILGAFKSEELWMFLGIMVVSILLIAFNITTTVGNFWTAPTKWLLSSLMLIGRLEIFPILIIFMPSTWKKRRG